METTTVTAEIKVNDYKTADSILYYCAKYVSKHSFNFKNKVLSIHWICETNNEEQAIEDCMDSFNIRECEEQFNGTLNFFGVI